MLNLKKTLRGAALTGLLLAGTAALAAGHGKPGNAAGRPGKAKLTLSPPELALDQDAQAKVDVKHFPAKGKRLERSWLRFKLRHLSQDGSYTLWMDDPSTPEDTTLVQVGIETYATNGRGNGLIAFDTKHEVALPFAATLAALGGKSVEIRDAEGVVVLAGAVPAIQ